MVVNDFEDDYKSDECDEHVAAELFYEAAFNEQRISVSCEEYIESRKSFVISKAKESTAISVETVAAAEIALCSGKPHSILQPVTVIALAETEKEESRNSLPISEADHNESENEGIATKLENSNGDKSRKISKKSSIRPSFSKDSPSRSKQSDENEDSDDINANIKPKRKKEKASALSKLKGNHRKHAGIKSSRKSQSPSPAATADGKVDQSVLDSTELPTLTPELSSDDEISLSDSEGLELNVISFGRGIPDKVTMKKKVSPEEHKRLWHVDIDDKFRHLRRHRYHTAKECRNCRQSGHQAHECPLPERIVCILCAETTHVAARCPNKICSICKNEGHSAWRCFRMQQLIETKCRICSLFGHRADICPDNWRRYHCTTVEGPPIAPEKNESLPHERKFCSWCGRQGHFAFECKRAGNSGIASRFVHSYREPLSKSSRSDERKKSKQEKTAKKREQTSQAEQGLAAVFGSDFIPIAAASKKFQNGSMSSNSKSRKEKRTNRSIAFAEEMEARKDLRRKRKFDADYGGIEMLPSVRKRQRRNGAESSDEKPLNRRKERRKLKRMQNRNERDKVKKKNSKNKGRA